MTIPQLHADCTVQHDIYVYEIEENFKYYLQIN